MDRVEECICFLLSKATQRVMRRARALFAEFDVTPQQYATLCVLWEQDGQTGAELGARLAIDSATMTGVIDRLERAELLERHPDGSDRRIYRLQLTPRGRELRAPLDSAMEKLNREVSDLLGQQTGIFYRMLHTISEIK